MSFFTCCIFKLQIAYAGCLTFWTSFDTKRYPKRSVWWHHLPRTQDVQILSAPLHSHCNAGNSHPVRCHGCESAPKLVDHRETHYLPQALCPNSIGRSPHSRGDLVKSFPGAWCRTPRISSDPFLSNHKKKKHSTYRSTLAKQNKLNKSIFESVTKPFCTANKICVLLFQVQLYTAHFFVKIPPSSSSLTRSIVCAKVFCPFLPPRSSSTQ